MGRSTYSEGVEYFWAPAVANKAAPTVDEMTAATELTCSAATLPDLTESTSTVDMPSICDRFTAKLPDTVSVDDGSLEFYYDDDPSSDEEAIRALLARDVSGFLIRVDSVNGTVPDVKTQGTTVDVWPATVSSNSKNQPVVGDIRKFTVGLTITSPPKTDVDVV